MNTPIGNLKFNHGYGYPECFVGKALQRHNEVVHNIYCNRRKVAELIEAMSEEGRYHLVYHAHADIESRVVDTLDLVCQCIYSNKRRLLRSLP